MTTSDAWLACRYPYDASPRFYSCIPSDAHDANMVWAPFDNADSKVLHFRINVVAESDIPWKHNRNIPSGTQLDMPKQRYIKMIAAARDYIQQTSAQKIVVSRTKCVELHKSFDQQQFFHHLCKVFPNAFVYLFITKNACWLGATPELLLDLHNKQLFTMSLAGTRWNQHNVLEWTKKERDEQLWVTTYIRERLQEMGLQNIEENGPYNRQAGHLQHLCTDIQGDAPVDAIPLLLAENLHPTPAVCGYPTAAALEFIRRNEVYKRHYYAGYIGLLEKNRARFFVNLRCMNVFDNHAVLFAGGGITIDSDPEKEWEETEQKMDVLLRLIQQA
jgi:isochorismate synthase